MTKKQLNHSANIFMLLILTVLLSHCGGSDSGDGGVSLNPGTDVLSFEKDGKTLTSITVEKNTIIQARLVIHGDPKETDTYTFEVNSDDHELIPPGNIQISGNGKFREITITPLTEKTGVVNLSGKATSAQLGVYIEASLKINVVEVGEITCVLNTSLLPCTLN